jgi:hypothetical protein
VFDDSTVITTPCRYDESSKRAFNIEASSIDVDDANALTDEFVTLPDGTKLRDDDGVEFDY